MRATFSRVKACGKGKRLAQKIPSEEATCTGEKEFLKFQMTKGRGGGSVGCGSLGEYGGRADGKKDET